MLIDTHAHLEMEPFDSDREAVLDRSAKAGVACIITVGTNLDLSRKAVWLTEAHDNIFATVGIHPHEAAYARGENLEKMIEIARHPKVVAYGEIGLDFFRNISPPEIQKEAFAAQLEIARALDLPVVIHDRNAHEEVLRMVTTAGVRKGVFHCFSGDYALAKKCLDLGFYISVPGTITFEKAGNIAEVVTRVPLDFLMLETDCPFLTPVPFRGKRNEPAFIVHTAEKVARIKSLSLEEVAAATTRNAKKLFALPNA